ncbi:MAG: DMT family transporter [Desulfosalsimonas sp.]
MGTLGGRTTGYFNDILMLAVINFWGLTFLFTKLGLKSLDPLSFANLRVAVAALALAVMAVFAAGTEAGGRMGAKDHFLAAGLGLLGMACFPFFFSLAMNYTSAANAGLIFGTTPVAVALISSIAGLERLGILQWTGLLLSFAGIAFIIVPSGLQVRPETIQGDLLMVAAMLNWSLYTVLNRFVPGRHSGLRFTACASLWGIAGLSLLSLGTLADLNPGQILPVSWLGGVCAGLFGTAVSYVIWNNAVRNIGPSKTAVYLNLVPLIASVSGFVILGEVIGMYHLIAAMFIIPGVIMTRKGRGEPFR